MLLACTLDFKFIVNKMSERLKDDIEKEVKNNSDPDKVEEKKEVIRKYQEDMVRYMNGITMVKIAI